MKCWICGAVLLGVALTSAAHSLRLTWDQPTDGGPVDYYTVYQSAPTNAPPVRLGTTKERFWTLSAFPTNMVVKWRVTAHRGKAESQAAELLYEPSMPIGKAEPTLVRSATIQGATNLVVNGGFEDHAQGWQLKGDCGISAHPGPVKASEGLRCVVFNSANSGLKGAASQTFQTQPGQAYQLTFDAGVISFTRRKGPQFLAVSVRGATEIAHQVVKVTPTERAKSEFWPQQLSFTADTNSVTLSFEDASERTERLHLLLDRVQVLPKAD